LKSAKLGNMKKVIIILIIIALFFLISFKFGFGRTISVSLLKKINIAYSLEKIKHETPEAKIDNYIQAIIKGNKEEALKNWEIFGGQGEILGEEREKITDKLINAKINPDFKIINIDWWFSCCMSANKSDYLKANYSRIKVEFSDKNNVKKIYYFDLSVLNSEDWIWDYSLIRHWVLSEVYPADYEPLLWFPDKMKNL
jgi:hypothetical protein